MQYGVSKSSEFDAEFKYDVKRQPFWIFMAAILNFYFLNQPFDGMIWDITKMTMIDNIHFHNMGSWHQELLPLKIWCPTANFWPSDMMIWSNKWHFFVEESTFVPSF